MDKEVLKEQVKKILEDLGAKQIEFSETEDGKVIVSFNWEKVVSFKANLSGWNYTGIQLDPSGKKEYKIEFYKI